MLYPGWCGIFRRGILLLDRYQLWIQFNILDLQIILYLHIMNWSEFCLPATSSSINLTRGTWLLIFSQLSVAFAQSKLSDNPPVDKYGVHFAFASLISFHINLFNVNITVNKNSGYRFCAANPRWFTVEYSKSVPKCCNSPKSEAISSGISPKCGEIWKVKLFFRCVLKK